MARLTLHPRPCHWNGKEHFEKLVSIGMDEKAVMEIADRHVLDDYRRAMSFGRTWVVYQVRVECRRAGVFVGPTKLAW